MAQAGLVTDHGPAVRVQGLAHAYKKTAALHGVDLEIGGGEIFGLIGPDGAGKSTLMRAVAGVLAFDDGRVDVLGRRVDSERSAESVKGRIGFMPQGLGQNLYPELSVDENIEFFASMRLVPPDEAEERKRALLEATRLDRFRDRAARNLSGGMRQKLGLVCTLIHRPELVILDEPTTGVDPVSRRDFWAILTDQLGQGGMTALVATSYMDEASRFQRLCLLHRGRIMDRGEPREILRRAGGAVVGLRSPDQARAMAAAKARFAQVEARGDRIRVFVDGDDTDEAEDAVRRAMEDKGADIREAETEEPELEDVFVAMLRRQGDDDEDEDDGPDGAAGDVRGGGPAKAGGGSGNEEPMVEARELVRDFGSFRAVDRVSFQVAPGEIFGLLGANGAGKTTVIKMLVDILPPSRGSGTVAGSPLRGGARRLKQRIGYMSQVFSLYGDLTVMENLRLYASIYGLPRSRARSRAAELLAMAGLRGREAARADGLPSGLRQRLALCCALLHEPRVLFLDEPTSGVDPVGRRRFWDILFDLSRRHGVSILITTHYMNEAEHCDRLALMHAGRLVDADSPANMKQALEDHAGKLLEVSADHPQRAARRLEEEFEGVSLHGDTVHLLAPDPDRAGERIEALLKDSGAGLRDVRQRPVGMEDVFVRRILELEQDREGRT